VLPGREALDTRPELDDLGCELVAHDDIARRVEPGERGVALLGALDPALPVLEHVQVRATGQLSIDEIVALQEDSNVPARQSLIGELLKRRRDLQAQSPER
jgi:hypothetical protein